MSNINNDKLEVIRQITLEELRQKYGADKVQQVDDLGEEITSRMLNGEKIDGIQQWMYDLLNDFKSKIISNFTKKFD